MPSMTTLVLALSYLAASATAIKPTTTATPAEPTLPGTYSPCGKYFAFQSGDSCSTVESKFGITLQQFLNLNCNVKSDCSNLQLGYDYCVAPVKGSKVKPCPTTSTSIAPPSKTAIPPPGPTESGTTANCHQWVVVQTGDTCASIESTYGITMAQLQKWNKSIADDCHNLYASEAYCVDGPPFPH